MIEDTPPPRRYGNRRRSRMYSLVMTPQEASNAVLTARRVIMADPRHNPLLADALAGVTAFLEKR